MENWDLEKLNKGIKNLDFIDFKLSQLASFAFGVMIVKLFPFVRRIGFKKILGLMIFSSVRPFYRFLSQSDESQQAADDFSAEEKS